jgi:hypothetical protein
MTIVDRVKPGRTSVKGLFMAEMLLEHIETRRCCYIVAATKRWRAKTGLHELT